MIKEWHLQICPRSFSPWHIFDSFQQNAFISYTKVDEHLKNLEPWGQSQQQIMRSLWHNKFNSFQQKAFIFYTKVVDHYRKRSICIGFIRSKQTFNPSFIYFHCETISWKMQLSLVYREVVHYKCTPLNLGCVSVSLCVFTSVLIRYLEPFQQKTFIFYLGIVDH